MGRAAVGGTAEDDAAPAALLAEHREEIIGWLVKESGGTVIKANVEVSQPLPRSSWRLCPPRPVHGRIMESNTPGRKTGSAGGPWTWSE